MSIVTKTGDNGLTSLLGGSRVEKDHPRVEAYGTIDELNCFLGLAKNFVQKKNADIIEEIQKHLFIVSAMLASPEEKTTYSISHQQIEFLEKYIFSTEKSISLNSFIVPGSNIASAYLDVSRTVSRRAERRVTTLRKNNSVSESLMIYLNRLSDALFLMARSECVSYKENVAQIA
ncbi:MAG: cob(I)yrinic acid a,c-diamide adenosyltransferase [Candidatus Riflebacteria bacterium]|nr:cob(I)yrinic acid a,c-diamide adenosyltransferase [Candidatus Riflebacteria bacterium]